MPRRRLVLVAAKLPLGRLLLLRLRHALVVEAEPVVRAQRADEGVVVAAVGAAAVDEHAVQAVHVDDRRVGVVGEVLAPVAVEVERRRELEALVDLRHRVGGKVVLEAAEVELEDGRQHLELHSLLGVLLAEALALVLVVAVEHLLLHVLVEARVQVLAPLDGHLQIVEVLVAQRDVLDLYALDVVGELAAEEVRHRPLDRRPLHLLLELVDEHAVELLHVVLHERVVRVPAERLGELLRRHRRVRVLQLVEDALQSERDRLLGVLLLRRLHVVHRLEGDGAR